MAAEEVNRGGSHLQTHGGKVSPLIYQQ